MTYSRKFQVRLLQLSTNSSLLLSLSFICKDTKQGYHLLVRFNLGLPLF